MGVPQVTMVVSILRWSNDLDDLGYPYFRNPPFIHGELYGGFSIADMKRWDYPLALKDGNGQSTI